MKNTGEHSAAVMMMIQSKRERERTNDMKCKQNIYSARSFTILVASLQHEHANQSNTHNQNGSLEKSE